MRNLKLIDNLTIKIFLILFLVLFSKDNISSENKIIFKINNNAYTTIDLEKRIEYLDFVGSNNSLDIEIIIDDFISANLFYEYYVKSNKNFKIEEKISEIYNNILDINKKNNKVYNYEIEKSNIIINIKIDYIRKIILENILNENIDNFYSSKEEIDLLYKLNVKYINFLNEEKFEIKRRINELETVSFASIKNLLDDQNINYFIKQDEINNIDKINKEIKKNILSNINFFIIEKKENLSLIFIEKKFETLNGLIGNLYSIRSKENLSKDFLLCNNLTKLNNYPNLINKEYKLIDLNDELKNNLVSINDYIKIVNNNENIYIILCNIKFDKDELKNFDLNKQINLNVNEIEKKFISKYSKMFNLIK